MGDNRRGGGEREEDEAMNNECSSIRSDYRLLHFHKIGLSLITFQLDQIIIIKWKN